MKAFISNKQIIGSTSGIIYRMHPYHNPEGMHTIINSLIDEMNKLPYKGNPKSTFKLYEFESWDAFEKWLHDVLFNILEFRQLNISKKLKDAGVIDTNDERNKGFRFTSAYDIETDDSRYTDFIDLDACVRNIVREIDMLDRLDGDCFLCTYAKEYGSMEPSDCDKCKTCSINPKYTYNRENHPMSIKPKNEWTEEEKELYKI